MDQDFFRQEAIDLYYTPYVIAERVTYEIYSRGKLSIYTDATKTRYTQEFISDCRARESRYTESTQEMVKDIEEINLQEPAFTDHWVADFMARNHLSFRHAHFKRRG